MVKSSLRPHFFRLLRRYRHEQTGNVALTFALAVIPILGFIGTAIDYSHANAIKTSMQTALDSTALMLANDASALTSEQLQTKASSYFDALFNTPAAKNVSVTATYTSNGGSSVVISGSADVPTSFLSAIGYDDIPVASSTTIKWGSTRLRVALVLDNTLSMADDGKMEALKTATKNLLKQLKSAAYSNDDVYVSIIPFSKDVNVGSALNYNADWIDWSDWDDDNGSWQNTSSCSNSGHSRRGRSHCKNKQTWVTADHSTWNGCITDRDQDYDQAVTAPNPADANLSGNSASTLFPAEQYDSCPVAMMGLNYDWTTMNNLVDSMQPDGTTNQPIGLVWGWQSLVGGGPLTAPAMSSSYKYQQIIILLSDGLNTENRWSSSQTQVDKRMYDSHGDGTCANIKAAGITIYTVQVNTGGDPTSTLLQNCASSTDKFFLLTSADDIVTTFDAIGNNLTKLRVAK